MAFDDARRIEALKDYRVLDTAPERSFDSLTELASKLFDTPIALVSLIDEHRQWFKSRVGLGASETPRAYAFCDHAIRQDSTLLVEDATKDPRFASNPLVTGDPGIRFYCGAVLRTPDGQGLGTLCVIDKVPRTVTEADRRTLEALARHVETEFEVHRRLALLDEALEAQRRRQDGKELLAAMVVHDLRGPLTSISLLADTLAVDGADAGRDLEDLRFEALRARRMLSDVLDLCLHGLGGLRPRLARLELNPLVVSAARRFTRRGRVRGQEVLAELPAGAAVVEADAELLDRLLENLLGNTMDHGPAGRPVRVALRLLEGSRIRLEVHDDGQPLPAGVRAGLFKAFETLAATAGAGGEGHRGLGLAFCRLAAESHGGTIGVEPGADRGNTFFVELPGAAGGNR